MRESRRLHPRQLISYPFLLLSLSSPLLGLMVTKRSLAQDNLAPARPADTRILEQRIRDSEQVLQDELPPLPPQVGPVQPLDSGEYILEFNRSPIVGSRLQLRSIYDEARLRFTRPRNWETEKAQIMLRFRHSPALYATRSNLSVLINGVSVGTVPLNNREGEIGTAIYDIPVHLLQDYNEVVVAALQNNSPTCTQDPFDPSLWTEVLPDSKLVFNFAPQPVALDFNQYPYPIFDELSLDPNRVAYLVPAEIDDAWLTAVARLQTSFGRFARYRPLETRLVRSPDELELDEKLIVIGSPQQFPELAASQSSLQLPLSLTSPLKDEQGKIVNSKTGLLMLGNGAEGQAVLVASGPNDKAVAQALQLLLQGADQEIATGQTVLVDSLEEVSSPQPRDWPGYLPDRDQFQLQDLTDFLNRPYGDVTVRGAEAPTIEYDLRALPDDSFLPGNEVALRYSYGPQMNPLTSLLEVRLDGLPLGGKKLDSIEGARDKLLRVKLPEEKIRHNSKLQVLFQMDPRERRSCNRAVDQHLWGTVHHTTEFDFNREAGVKLPDLERLQAGYPFAAPQDLSRTAVVLPDEPRSEDILLLIELSERLGRLSRADSVKLGVYRASQLSDEVRDSQHLIAIGTQDRFPFSEALETGDFRLKDSWRRQRQGRQGSRQTNSEIRTLPDADGVIREILSPWNSERVLLMLTAQTPAGLERVRDLFDRDGLFFQLQKDTVLIGAKTIEPSPYNPRDYDLAFLSQAPKQRKVSEISQPEQLRRSLLGSWIFLIPGLLVLAALGYGVVQTYLNRFAPPIDDEASEESAGDLPEVLPAFATHGEGSDRTYSAPTENGLARRNGNGHFASQAQLTIEPGSMPSDPQEEQ